MGQLRELYGDRLDDPAHDPRPDPRARLSSASRQPPDATCTLGSPCTTSPATKVSATGIARSRGGLLGGVVGRCQRVGVEEHQVGGHAGMDAAPPVDAGRQRLAHVSACSGCQACALVGAAVDGGGDRPATGRAARPARRSRGPARTPASTIQRNAKQRSARSGQHSSVTSRSSRRWAGCTLARRPSRAIAAASSRRTSWACSIEPARAGRVVRREGLAQREVADRVGRDLEPVARGPGRAGASARRWSGWPRRRRTRRRTPRSTRRCGC